MTNQRKGEIAYKIFLTIFEDGQQEPSVFGPTSCFACRAVSSELRKLFEATEAFTKLVQVTDVGPAELNSFARVLYHDAGMPPPRTKSSHL
jgi:hypothetical protein